MSDKNMELWNQVCTTDPRWLKWVPKKHGGYCSVNSQKQRKLCTELWGPYGAKWGLRNLRYQTKDPRERLTCEFFYPIEDAEVFFTVVVSVMLKDRLKDGTLVDADEIEKKLITEAQSKALSFLGFSSDVYEGEWSEYRLQMEMRKINGSLQKDDPQEPEKSKPKKTWSQVLNELIEKALAANSMDMLLEADVWWRKKYQEKKISEAVFNEGIILINDNRGALTQDAFQGESVPEGTYRDP